MANRRKIRASGPPDDVTMTRVNFLDALKNDTRLRKVDVIVRSSGTTYSWVAV